MELTQGSRGAPTGALEVPNPFPGGSQPSAAGSKIKTQKTATSPRPPRSPPRNRQGYLPRGTCHRTGMAAATARDPLREACATSPDGHVLKPAARAPSPPPAPLVGAVPPPRATRVPSAGPPGRLTGGAGPSPVGPAGSIPPSRAPSAPSAASVAQRERWPPAPPGDRGPSVTATSSVSVVASSPAREACRAAAGPCERPLPAGRPAGRSGRGPRPEAPGSSGAGPSQPPPSTAGPLAVELGSTRSSRRAFDRGHFAVCFKG